MATKNFRSTVLEPTSEFAHGDKLRFTALATVGEVLKGSFSEMTIGEDGVYSVDLQYGKHRIDYKPYEGVWRHFSDVEVNADTLATTLQDLALASVPVTDETILVLQGILADAEAVKTESAAIRDEAAASAAAAAEDAAKLADITPESIGAVSASGAVTLRPQEQSFYFNLTNDKSIKITLPPASNTSIMMALIELSISTTTHTGTGANEWVRVSFGGYHFPTSLRWISPTLTVTGGSSTISVTTEQSADEWSIILTRAGGWISSSVIIDKITLGGVDGRWATGWTMSEVDTPVAPASMSAINGTAMPTENVAMIERNGVVYRNIDADTATDAGISSAVFDAALAEQKASELFKTEKSIALQIFSDFNLGTGEHEITGSDIADVRAYIQSIDPAKGLKAGHLQRAKIPRPSIFDRYS